MVFARLSFSRPSANLLLRNFRFGKLQYIGRSTLYVKFSVDITKEFLAAAFLRSKKLCNEQTLPGSGYKNEEEYAKKFA